jgi:Integrase core domain
MHRWSLNNLVVRGDCEKSVRRFSVERSYFMWSLAKTRVLSLVRKTISETRSQVSHPGSMTPSTAAKFRPQFAPWISRLCGPPLVGPWQNGVAERWVGSCRRELLDHVIAVNEIHLKRLLASYADYYHADRIHCGLQKQTPKKRTRCAGRGRVIAWPRVGGLHHRYERVA